jgi:hypothetical protein
MTRFRRSFWLYPLFQIPLILFAVCLVAVALCGSFNSNHRWVNFWQCCALIAFMWLIALPLDKLIFQGLFKLPMNLSGQLVIANSLFWTVLISLIMCKVIGLPFLSSS